MALSDDGGLRTLFRGRLPRAQWTTVESRLFERGIPDVEYCFPGGLSGWIEFKQTRGWRVRVRPEQVGWIERRARLGGRVFVAVRRRSGSADELWMVRGRSVRELKMGGLRGHGDGLVLEGGPANWDWEKIEQLLCK